MSARATTTQTLALAVGALALGTLSACGVTVSGPTGHVQVATDYYSPLYYNGYIVYYDSAGRPIYYANGTQHYVPTSHDRYHVYVRHYRSRRGEYRRWYRSRGRRLRKRRYRRRRKRRRKVRRHKRRRVRRKHRHKRKRHKRDRRRHKRKRRHK